MEQIYSYIKRSFVQNMSHVNISYIQSIRPVQQDNDGKRTWPCVQQIIIQSQLLKHGIRVESCCSYEYVNYTVMREKYSAIIETIHIM
jgi:hypothetical protein